MRAITVPSHAALVGHAVMLHYHRPGSIMIRWSALPGDKAVAALFELCTQQLVMNVTQLPPVLDRSVIYDCN